MGSGGGGGGRSGRGKSASGGGGDAGQPGEVVRAANEANRGHARPGDTKMTAMLRKEYETNTNINVSVKQLKGGETVITHSMGSAVVGPNGVAVQGSNGKRYQYSQSNLVKGLQHFESLAGSKWFKK